MFVVKALLPIPDTKATTQKELKMSHLPIFTKKFVQEFEVAVGLLQGDLMLSSRKNRYGDPTFALGIHYGGTQFPRWILEGSFKDIKQSLVGALEAKALLDSHGIEIPMCFDASSVCKTTRQLSELGRLYLRTENWYGSDYYIQYASDIEKILTKLGVNILIDTDSLGISESTPWEEVHQKVWAHIRYQLGEKELDYRFWEDSALVTRHDTGEAGKIYTWEGATDADLIINAIKLAESNQHGALQGADPKTCSVRRYKKNISYQGQVWYPRIRKWCKLFYHEKRFSTVHLLQAPGLGHAWSREEGSWRAVDPGDYEKDES